MWPGSCSGRKAAGPWRVAGRCCLLQGPVMIWGNRTCWPPPQFLDQEEAGCSWPPWVPAPLLGHLQRRGDPPSPFHLAGSCQATPGRGVLSPPFRAPRGMNRRTEGPGWAESLVSGSFHDLMCFIGFSPDLGFLSCGRWRAPGQVGLPGAVPGPDNAPGSLRWHSAPMSSPGGGP